ncbi:5-formyltetrahydrofolate cyclo-ligase [Malassezia cuniculi]|uniref:5-formyltetrahydrofolate cyclo-ligase n=1 Tax=Malassezia cuniculi TaxID=948313 RepID=A0AAF0EYX7_9BASI|nr:5-formyltetrahydrofolate cyclo-ligase [Malassezia cuniculi]
MANVALARAKRTLRRETGAALRQIAQTDVDAQSRTITDAVTALPAYRAASSISVYISMPTAEVATWDLCRDALRAGKRLYVPRFSEAGSSFSVDMDMLRLRNEHELHTLIPNTWGIGEPSSQVDGAPRENALEADTGGNGLDMIILPGVAFDRFGGRLGHGKGYYDRYVRRTREFNTQHNIPPPTLGESAANKSR